MLLKPKEPYNSLSSFIYRTLKILINYKSQNKNTITKGNADWIKHIIHTQ
jgi:hypothetical protein